MVDKSSIQQILGSLMKHPQFLSETDKYNLTPDDFYTKFEKYIFAAIANLYNDGATNIQPIDVENYLSTNQTGRLIFRDQRGIEYLQDAQFYCEIENFPYYYKRLKKFNLLNYFAAHGIDVSEFYIDDPLNPKAQEVNKDFELLEIQDIVDSIKKKVLSIERQFIQNDTTEVRTADQGIEDIIYAAAEQIDVGAPLQGEIFNEVCAGARKGILVVRSAGSGTGKTRQAVGDGCNLAYPFRYDWAKHEWVQMGNNKKVLFIATEQNHMEIQKMILAYLTGMNESKFRYGLVNDEERLVIKQAIWLMQQYSDHFRIVRMPNPTIELVKTIVRENVLAFGIEYVFYDYIFIGPSLLGEFKGFALRNDEILLMFATALKDLAVELNIFVMTSTQVNAKADDSNELRNEGSIAGSRAIVNKADIGVIMARPTKEELSLLKDTQHILNLPNIVTDVYKVRSGVLNQVRIWSLVDLGTLRKVDLFVTDARMEPIKDFSCEYTFVPGWEDDVRKLWNEQLNHLKGMTLDD